MSIKLRRLGVTARNVSDALNDFLEALDEFVIIQAELQDAEDKTTQKLEQLKHKANQ